MARKDRDVVRNDPVGLAADAGRRQALLETDDVIDRCRALLEILTDLWKDAALRQGDPGVPH